MSAQVSEPRRAQQRAAQAMAHLADTDPEAALAISEYLAVLRRECAHWRTRVRELEGRR